MDSPFMYNLACTSYALGLSWIDQPHQDTIAAAPICSCGIWQGHMYVREFTYLLWVTLARLVGLLGPQSGTLRIHL